MWLKVLVLTLLCVKCISGFAGGAGTTACTSMMPGHNQLLPQTTPAPISITTTTNNLRQGQNMTMTLQSLNDFTFAGFIVQVRLAPGGNQVIGRFHASAGMRSVNCSPLPPDAVVTHINNSPKVRVEFVWEAPSGFTGVVSFQ